MNGLGLKSWLVQVCRALGIFKPFPVQVECIPRILRGESLLACAPTGQGKTASYVLPLLQRFHDLDSPIWFALTIAPTRELAMQIREQICLFGQSVAVRVVLLIGGESVCTQKNALLERPCHFIVATPGRLFDIIDSDAHFARRFQLVQALCLDECDNLLDESMAGAMAAIRQSLPIGRIQTLCFSATLTPESQKTLRTQFNITEEEHAPFINMMPKVGGAAKKSKTKSERKLSEEGGGSATVGGGAGGGEGIADPSEEGGPTFTAEGAGCELTPKTLTQLKYFCSATPVYHILHHLLKTPESEFCEKRGIIFTGTIQECETLNIAFQKLKISIISLHSLHSQKDRSMAIEKFKTEKARVLIATNVAARGLDLPKVAWVINLDVPKKIDDYIHRVGRCARAGNPGTALTFVQQTLRHEDESKDANTIKVKAIEKALCKMKRLRIDEEAALMHPNRVHKAIARAKQLLEEQKFADKLHNRQKRRRLG